MIRDFRCRMRDCCRGGGWITPIETAAVRRRICPCRQFGLFFLSVRSLYAYGMTVLLLIMIV
jgi:hypothetical protein